MNKFAPRAAKPQLDSESRSRESAIRNPQSAIRNPESRIRNPESESAIRNRESAIRNRESAIRNRESAIRNRESGIRNPLTSRTQRRAGITLTEILIAIMILGVGLVSLATLFPIGLVRLRDATRYTRSALLLQSAACDIEARGLLYNPSFAYADNINYQFGMPPWYFSPIKASNNVYPPSYNPLLQDTAYYGDDPADPNNPGASGISGGPGLPFAYDPLWRYQTGIYLDTLNESMPEARFGSGIGFLRPDSSGGFSSVASAHGLQRLTNFNRPYFGNGNAEIPIQPASLFVPNIFVSQEDMVWQDPKVNTYTINGSSSHYPTRHHRPQPAAPRPESPSGLVESKLGGLAHARLALLVVVHRPADQPGKHVVLRRQHRDLGEPALRHPDAA